MEKKEVQQTAGTFPSLQKTQAEFELSTTCTFHAAHRLEAHKGRCHNLHGHTYKVKVDVTSPAIYAESNMVMDFGDLNDIVRYCMAELDLDHNHLNQVLDCKNPTAEFIALTIFNAIEMQLKIYWQEACPCNIVQLKRVKVWETPNQAASVCAIRQERKQDG